MLNEYNVRIIAATHWENAKNKNEIIKSFEDMVGHEFTDKDIILLGAMFVHGTVFWHNYLTAIGNSTEE